MSAKGIAVVTGASKGIGRAISLRLANDGFDVALNDIPSQMDGLESLRDEISQKGRKSMIVVGDVSVEDDVKSLVNDVGATLGGSDVFVDGGQCWDMLTEINHGEYVHPDESSKTLLHEATLDEWERLFAVNSRGVFLCYKYAGQYMVNQGRGGRMIAASSVSGKQGTDILGAYCATKFAVRGMTQAFAKALGNNGITVNAYAPGATETEMFYALGREVRGDVDKFYAEERAATAVKLVGAPIDIASLVSYLASKESRFITGQSISINGGTYFD